MEPAESLCNAYVCAYVMLAAEQTGLCTAADDKHSCIYAVSPKSGPPTDGDNFVKT